MFDLLFAAGKIEATLVGVTASGEGDRRASVTDIPEDWLAKINETYRRDDCVDYALGLDDIRKIGQLPTRASRLLENADRELTAAIAQLNSSRPNPKAILSARMATEIFLKVLLVAKRNLSEVELKKLSHDIAEIADFAN